jgi:hypothetical protein
MSNANDPVPPPTRDQFERRADFVRAYDRWRDKHDPRRKKRAKAGLSADDYQRAMYAKHQEKRLAQKKGLYAAKREMLLDRQAKWRDGNRDKLQARDRRRYEGSYGLLIFNNKRRLEVLRKATPVWLTEEHKRQMAEIYKAAAHMTEITGVEHAVDHIWPLRGRHSCGLHVPWNLQVVPANWNKRKQNKEPTDG